LGVVNNKQLLGLAYRLEKKCYLRAKLVTGQTQGIVDNINKRFPNVNTFWLPNGVDVNFYQPEKIETGDFRERAGLKSTDVVFFYGGILGHAQGLSTVLEAAKKVECHEHIKIVLQGAGPEKEDLLALKEKLQLKNLVFMPPVEKSQMPSILKSVDVALVPLKKLDIFQGAIPSKIFEALAMKKPLLLGVDGEARIHFIEKANAGRFTEPENVDDLAKNLILMASNPDELKEMGERARSYVSEHFNRDNIAQKFYDVLRSN
jgi:glycosyltransferase involved in cell wall biosynthesis